MRLRRLCALRVFPELLPSPELMSAGKHRAVDKHLIAARVFFPRYVAPMTSVLRADSTTPPGPPGTGWTPADAAAVDRAMRATDTLAFADPASPLPDTRPARARSIAFLRWRATPGGN